MKNKDDDLISKIDRIVGAQNIHDLTHSKAFDESRTERMSKDIKGLRRFIFQVGVALTWVWKWTLHPILKALSNFSSWILKQYRKLWSLTVYQRNQYGTLMLSKTRAGVFLLCTALFLWCSVGILGFTYDGILYATTVKHNEIFYLHGSQETNVTGNVHSVKGCSHLPCSDEDSLYFRVTPSLFNHIWSIWNDHMLFYPDYVAAAVPDVVNKCTITTYGIRLKLLVRNTDIYPELLKASCQPVSVKD